jgi:hypothetical protein
MFDLNNKNIQYIAKEIQNHLKLTDNVGFLMQYSIRVQSKWLKLPVQICAAS